MFQKSTTIVLTIKEKVRKFPTYRNLAQFAAQKKQRSNTFALGRRLPVLNQMDIGA
jgi:hypothetical protein